jgi:putative membrane protein
MFSRRHAVALVFLLIGISGIVPASAQDSGRPSQNYVTKAAIGDLFEIQSSRLALRKSDDGKVKDFASRMVRDHTASSAKLKSIIKAGELPLVPPTKLDDAHQQMLDGLAGANGADFDKMYMEMQIKAHEEAVALHQGYAENGMEEKLKAFAKKTSMVVETHLGMLKTMHAM